MMKCREATQLASQARERPLSLIEKMRLRLHLSICKACRRFDRNLSHLSHMMKQFTQRQDPSERHDPRE